MEKLLPRFLEYVALDTQSDPNSKTTPSTLKQLDLAKKLVHELYTVGMVDVQLDPNGYIMATLPSNVDKNLPTIGFIAHYDTTPDYIGRNVSPQVVENYDGGDIVLDEDRNILLSPNEFPELSGYINQTLITTDGNTLLGADDKAGIAEIITAMEHLIRNPEIKHGDIRVAFTPDEEIGRGAHKFDIEKFGADWAYTVDGGEIGELQYESFNAAKAKVEFFGKSIHPGLAKGQMVNAIGIANEFLNMFPPEEVPERTAGTEGFFHVYNVWGQIENVELQLLIRDHNNEHFAARKNLLQHFVDSLNEKYGKCVTLEIVDQYHNMKAQIDASFHIVEIAARAMVSSGIKPLIRPIRGGTDGVQLSYMGLPCPNIFTGGHNFHGKFEYIPLESMQKAVQVIVKICEFTEKKFKANGKMRRN